jgi:hypothetical protein
VKAFGAVAELHLLLHLLAMPLAKIANYADHPLLVKAALFVNPLVEISS